MSAPWAPSAPTNRAPGAASTGPWHTLRTSCTLPVSSCWTPPTIPRGHPWPVAHPWPQPSGCATRTKPPPTTNGFAQKWSKALKKPTTQTPIGSPTRQLKPPVPSARLHGPRKRRQRLENYRMATAGQHQSIRTTGLHRPRQPVGRYRPG